MNNKTHYRKAFNSPYLSSADIVGNTNLTIDYAVIEKDKTKRTKEDFLTLYFREKELRVGEELKPMILNSTNSKAMAALADTPYIDDWKGLFITVYVDHKVKMMGDTVAGLRISHIHPTKEKPQLQPETKAWVNAVDALKRDGNLNAVKKRMNISPENEALLVEQSKEVIEDVA